MAAAGRPGSHGHTQQDGGGERGGQEPQALADSGPEHLGDGDLPRPAAGGEGHAQLTLGQLGEVTATGGQAVAQSLAQFSASGHFQAEEAEIDDGQQHQGGEAEPLQEAQDAAQGAARRAWPPACTFAR